MALPAFLHSSQLHKISNSFERHEFSVLLHADAQARLVAWKNMSDPGRQQFGWPQPGLDRGADDSLFQPQASMQLWKGLQLGQG